MVSADNLNLDVLELIFAFLSGNDLPSVASVSRSFLAGVIPRLYRRIFFLLKQAKGYDVSCCAAMSSMSLLPETEVVGRAKQCPLLPQYKPILISLFMFEA